MQKSALVAGLEKAYNSVNDFFSRAYDKSGFSGFWKKIGTAAPKSKIRGAFSFLGKAASKSLVARLSDPLENIDVFISSGFIAFFSKRLEKSREFVLKFGRTSYLKEFRDETVAYLMESPVRLAGLFFLSALATNTVINFYYLHKVSLLEFDIRLLAIVFLIGCLHVRADLEFIKRDSIVIRTAMQKGWLQKIDGFFSE